MMATAPISEIITGLWPETIPGITNRMITSRLAAMPISDVAPTSRPDEHDGHEGDGDPEQGDSRTWSTMK